MLKETNTPTRPRIEPGSPDPESDALTIRPVRPPSLCNTNRNKVKCCGYLFESSAMQLYWKPTTTDYMKNYYFYKLHLLPKKVLVIPRNRWLRLNMTEKLFTGTLNHNQNKNKTNFYKLNTNPSSLLLRYFGCESRVTCILTFEIAEMNDVH